MIGIEMFRKAPEPIKESQRKRGESTEIVDEVLKYDKLWRTALKENDKLRHERNVMSAEISKLKKESKNVDAQIKRMNKINEEIERTDKLVKDYLSRRDKLRIQIGNVLDSAVPVGRSEEDNVELRKCGKPHKFDFKPQSHLEIAIQLGLIDTERGAKATGAGFYYLRDDLVLLDYALLRYTIDFMRAKNYTLVEPPFMLRRKPYEGVTDLADFDTVMYKIEQEDLYLIATSEHPLGAMLMDEVLKAENLPLKFVGISPCFRKEIGTHGKYTKGLFRMHQFNKVEQFIFCLPEDSERYHEELQRNAEELYQNLGLPYRVINVCSGEIGKIAAKKYDIELWMADNVYREAGSNSNCRDYQARRLNIRYEKNDKREYVHTLNNTAIATSRTMLAILENYQQKDGTVLVPQILQKYMGKKRIGYNG